MPLDIGVGILISILVAHQFSIPLDPILIVLGIGASLFPDIDIITKLWGRWRHRELTHYPFAYVPVLFVVYLLVGPMYTSLLLLGVFAHLIHDTIGIGWGVSWFWPLTRRRFLFFPEKGRRRRYGWCMTWLPEERKKIIEDPVVHNWVITYYLRPSILGAVEYGVFFIAIITLIIYFT